MTVWIYIAPALTGACHGELRISKLRKPPLTSPSAQRPAAALPRRDHCLSLRHAPYEWRSRHRRNVQPPARTPAPPVPARVLRARTRSGLVRSVGDGRLQVWVRVAVITRLLPLDNKPFGPKRMLVPLPTRLKSLPLLRQRL